ncbi:ARHGDIG isoform 2, partial [Pan troglodytes]
MSASCDGCVGSRPPVHLASGYSLADLLVLEMRMGTQCWTEDQRRWSSLWPWSHLSSVLLADKEGGPPAVDEVLDEAVPEYRAPGRKSLLEIRQLDPDDRSLAKYKRVLLGPLPPAVDPSLPNVQVTRLTLLSEQAP